MKLSIEILTYAPKADDSLIHPWLNELSAYGMKCEVHPDFSFSDSSGYLPIKLRLLKPTRQSFENVDFISGFELYVDDFDFAAFSASQKRPPRGLLNFLWPLKGRSSALTEEIEAILATCTKCLTFRFSPADLFELRLADMSSILLMELTRGIRFLPADNQWHYSKGDALSSLESIKEFESSLPEDGFSTHPFEKWR
jgi:hypothetical protein